MSLSQKKVTRFNVIRFGAQYEEREGVGLTPIELIDLCEKSYRTGTRGETFFNRGYFADAIEAKLKEKNT